jgi:hypothetical protein
MGKVCDNDATCSPCVPEIAAGKAKETSKKQQLAPTYAPPALLSIYSCCSASFGGFHTYSVPKIRMLVYSVLGYGYPSRKFHRGTTKFLGEIRISQEIGLRSGGFTPLCTLNVSAPYRLTVVTIQPSWLSRYNLRNIVWVVTIQPRRHVCSETTAGI